MIRRLLRRRTPPAAGDRLRVGMLRIAQESNALTPRLTEVSDFTIDMAGSELMHATSPDGMEAPGFLKNAELSGFRQAVAAKGDGRIEVVPLFGMWAVPAGPLSAAATQQIRDRLREVVAAAGPLDAVFVSVHGAMVGEGGSAPEDHFLADLRELIGPEALIAVTIDLHAHGSTEGAETAVLRKIFFRVLLEEITVLFRGETVGGAVVNFGNGNVAVLRSTIDEIGNRIDTAQGQAGDGGVDVKTGTESAGDKPGDNDQGGN